MNRLRSIKKKGPAKSKNQVVGVELGPIKLPEFLCNQVDIRPKYDDNGKLIEATYSCSEMSKAKFQESSNVDHVIQMFVETIVL